MIDEFAAALLLVFVQGAAAQEECLSRAQAGTMAVVLVPPLIDSVTEQCAAHLPPTAFLGNGSRALTARLRADTAAVREQALTAIFVVAGQAEPAPGQDPDRVMRVLTDGMATGLDAVKCRSANELFEALAPLPTANLGQAFGAVVAVLAAEAREDAPAICPA